MEATSKHTVAHRRISGRSAVLGALVGLSAVAVLTPSLASGNARTNVGSGAAAARINTPLVAQLKGASEVPGPADPDGEGGASITIDPTTTEVCFDLRATGIDAPTAAHIHDAPAGAAGPVLVTLTPPSSTTSTSSGCVLGSAQVPPVTTVQLEDIVANPAEYYVNVHTAVFPAGAIRGQLSSNESKTGDLRLLDEPLRAYDSRLVPNGTLRANTTRVISLANGLDGAGNLDIAVPPGAVAAVLKLTVDQAVGAGFLKIYSNALTTPPPTASVNWYENGAIVGETGPVAVDGESKVKVTSGVNDTHFVIDVVGFVY